MPILGRIRVARVAWMAERVRRYAEMGDAAGAWDLLSAALPLAMRAFRRCCSEYPDRTAEPRSPDLDGRRSRCRQGTVRGAATGA